MTNTLTVTSLPPTWQSDCGNVQLYHGDCLEVLPYITEVDAIVTDPPYYKVKTDDWDRQWPTAGEFLSWLDKCAEEWARMLTPNGSLYCFTSPQMSARVEVMIGERFNVLNSIRWVKEAGWHNKAKKETLRQFLSPWESCIFAEHYGADNTAKGEAGYQAKCDELRGFVFEPLRKYICDEFERAGMLNQKGKIALNVACGFSPTPGGMASRHYFSQSQWCLPTEEHYEAMRLMLNNCGGDYLRREYEDLRREYEDLRRPFSVTPEVPYTDVWTFEPVRPYKDKHPCEKPQDMLTHIIEASSREGATVLDCFMGTGSTGAACVRAGRKFIGIELDESYFEKAKTRIQGELSQGKLF